MLSVSGCSNEVISERAVCEGTLLARSDHARALALDGGVNAMETGITLIKLLDAGCQDQ